jgi:phosphatidylglycerophosphate synthase
VALARHYCTPLVVRWLFMLRMQGFDEIQISAPEDIVLAVEKLVGSGEKLGLIVTYTQEQSPTRDEKDTSEVLWINADYLIDPEALRAFLEKGYFEGTGGGKTLLKWTGRLASAGSVELDSLVEPARRPAWVYGGDLRGARSAILKWSQKRIHLTSRLNAPLENTLIWMLGDTCEITPNRITLTINLLLPLAVALFLTGEFLYASLFSYFLGVLDGVDGKLARARGVLSRLGHLEHSLDTLYEQALYASFTLGLAIKGYGVLALAMGLAFIVTDSFVRHLYNQFQLVVGKPLKEYSDFNRKFSRVDGRRNFYVIYFIVSSALGVPLIGLAAALTHSVITAVVYLISVAVHLDRLDEEEGTKSFLRLIRVRDKS